MKNLDNKTLQGQTVHWIGAQICFCTFLDSRDKSLNMSKFCRNDQRKLNNKKGTKGASWLRNPLTIYNSLNAQFGLVMKKIKIKFKKKLKFL